MRCGPQPLSYIHPKMRQGTITRIFCLGDRWHIDVLVVKQSVLDQQQQLEQDGRTFEQRQLQLEQQQSAVTIQLTDVTQMPIFFYLEPSFQAARITVDATKFGYALTAIS
ncbi:hypothetical protein ALC53_12178 [Atta colombica]|uniref:Uncharacterized protein n=1 Tax=Atta colombica TaxID=520822 RepID=A0A195AZC2_9HYME|nr:hypothetical protein ALC53_12178 [Atta colombica]